MVADGLMTQRARASATIVFMSFSWIFWPQQHKVWYQLAAMKSTYPAGIGFITIPGIIVCMCPANERRRYKLQRHLALAGCTHKMIPGSVPATYHVYSRTYWTVVSHKMALTLYTLEKNPAPIASCVKSSNRNRLETACLRALHDGPGVRVLSGDFAGMVLLRRSRYCPGTTRLFPSSRGWLWESRPRAGGFIVLAMSRSGSPGLQNIIWPQPIHYDTVTASPLPTQNPTTSPAGNISSAYNNRGSTGYVYKEKPHLQNTSDTATRKIRRLFTRQLRKYPILKWPQTCVKHWTMKLVDFTIHKTYVTRPTPFQCT